MEQITTDTTYPQTKPYIPALWRSPYLHVVWMLGGVLAITILTISMLGVKTLPPDPFAVFSGIFPGQQMNTYRLEAQGYSCWLDPLPTTDDISQHCSQDLQMGQFSHITVSIWNGNVKQLTLNARENTLSIGDLIFFWGKPRIHQHDSWGQIDWPRGDNLYLTVSYKGRYSLFRSAGSIMFTWKGDFESMNAPTVIPPPG